MVYYDNMFEVLEHVMNSAGTIYHIDFVPDLPLSLGFVFACAPGKPPIHNPIF
jgi:hypothetical protein